MRMKKVALLIYICFGWISVLMGQTCPVAGNADITPTAYTVCPGTSVTFSLEGPYFGGGAGSTITYAWYINGTYVSSAADSYTTSSLNNGDQVYCIISATKSGCTTATVTTSTVTERVLQPAFTAPSGSTTVCPGSSTTYTTSGVNFTSYNWALSPSSAGTVSGNTTAATVQWASGYSGAATLSISSSNSTCTTNSSSSAPLTVRALATTPTAINGSGTVCQESTGTYSTTASNADNFYWSITSSAGTSPVGSGTASTSIVFPSGVSGPATLSVYAVGCHTTSAATMPVNITPTVGASSPPAGPAQLCQGSAPTVFTTATASNATGYVWSISPSSAGTVSGSGTSGTVTWNSGFTGAATLSVQASGCNAAAAAMSTVNIVGPLGTVSAISGSASVANSNAGGVSGTYTATAANALGYTWSLTPGEAGTISGAGGTATVTWSPLFSGNAYVSVTANGCSSSVTATPLAVAVALPLSAGSISPGSLTIASGTSPGQLMVTSAAG